jgi:hypothetical protein
VLREGRTNATSEAQLGYAHTLQLACAMLRAAPRGSALAQ